MIPRLLLAALLLLPAACSSTRDATLRQARHCPSAGILHGAQAISTPGFHAQFGRISADCSISGQNPVTIEVRITLSATLERRGDNPETRQIRLPLFTALTLDGREIITKKLSNPALDLPKTSASARFRGEEILFSPAQGRRGSEYQILAGFRVSPETMRANLAPRPLPDPPPQPRLIIER